MPHSVSSSVLPSLFHFGLKGIRREGRKPGPTYNSRTCLPNKALHPIILVINNQASIFTQLYAFSSCMRATEEEGCIHCPPRLRRLGKLTSERRRDMTELHNAAEEEEEEEAVYYSALESRTRSTIDLSLHRPPSFFSRATRNKSRSRPLRRASSTPRRRNVKNPENYPIQY